MLAAALATAFLLAAARPPADPEAMREAVGRRGARESYASSRAYLHYLKARLAEQAGDYGKAIEELRVAIVYDDGSPELHTALGWLQARVGAIDRAEAEARRALRLAPASDEAHLLLGKILGASHRDAEATAALEKAIELSPLKSDPYVTLVGHLSRSGDLARAEAVAARFSRVFPGEGEPWRILARAAKERGDAAATERFLRTAATHDPWDFEALLELASREADRGDDAAAQKDYERVLHRDPEQAEALLGAARLALRRGDDAAARAYFQQLLGSSAGSDVRARAALTYLAARRHAEAMTLIDEAARLEPDNPRLPYYRGLVLEAQRRFEEAGKAYLGVPERSRELRASALARAASVLSLAGSFDPARAATREALELVRSGLAGEAADEVIAVIPDVYRRAGAVDDGRKLLAVAAEHGDGVELRIAISRSRIDGGELDAAVAGLREALATWPGDDRVVFALAAALDRTDAWQEGVSLARGLLAGDPDNASALNFIGYAYADRGVHLDEARALIQQALRIRPGDGYYLDSLGWCEYQRGNVRAAIDALEKADAASPGEPVILQHLGAAYARAGRSADAVQAWTRALRLLDADPDPMVRPQIEAQLQSVRSEVVRQGPARAR